MDQKKKELMEKLFKRLPEVKLNMKDTALLVIDMQYVDACRHHGMGAKADELGLEKELDYYFTRVEKIVTPNIQKLLQLFRQKGGEILYARIESLTQNGRDRSLPHKMLGVGAEPNSREGEILEPLKPLEDEIVLSKTASGVFNSTNIDYILRNLGINKLIMTGVLTNECVETACRNAADRSYEVIMVEDACAALTEELHQASIKTLDGVYAQIQKTDVLMEKIKEVSE